MEEAANIIVKVPKQELDHLLLDKCSREKGREAWWTVRRPPARVRGAWRSNILFQCEGVIVAVAPVDRVEQLADGRGKVVWETHLARVLGERIEGRPGAWRGYTYVDPARHPGDLKLDLLRV